MSYTQTVTIGTQVWMTKNLDVATFRNGDPIPQAKTDEEWDKANEKEQPAWCYYDNLPRNGEKYGKLYNWYAVNDPRGLAPEGWHVPSDAEWTVLIDYLGGGDVAGTKMKSKSGWDSYTTGGPKTCPNCANWNAEYRGKVPCHTCQDTRSVPAPEVTGNGTNISGFSGLPGGARNERTFTTIGEFGYWWSSTEYYIYAWFHCLGYGGGPTGKVYNRVFYYKHYGFSVRCLRD